MKVLIGHAYEDENGAAYGGKPGDQTGKELRISEWYLNKKGWRVLRPIDQSAAALIAYDAKAACDNRNIGYDQHDRSTLFTVAAKVGYDCARVTTPCETDCSALVRVCCWYAGVKVGGFNTESEAKALLATGKFVELKGDEYTTKPDMLRPGDILVTKTKGHTCIVISTDQVVEPEPDPTVQTVRIKGGSVRVRAGDSTATRCIGIVHRGEKFPLLGTAPSGWYKIEWHGCEAYVTNKKQYTEVIA